MLYAFGRESYQFMYERPWQEVLDFYSHAVNGRLSLSSLGTEVGIQYQRFL